MTFCARLRLASPRSLPSLARHASSSVRRLPPRSTLLWLIPVTGGLTLCLAPVPESLLPILFSSPTLIPCPSPSPTPSPSHLQPSIFSPAESHRSLAARLSVFLRNKIWEPLLTARRFIHLFALFIPVIISSPMLLVGKPHKRYRGETWGAVWWYGLLVSTMEAAGPTFIKVRFPIHLSKHPNMEIA